MTYQIRPADPSLWPELGRGIPLDRRDTYPAAVVRATRRAANDGEDYLITDWRGGEIATVSSDGRVRLMNGSLML